MLEGRGRGREGLSSHSCLVCIRCEGYALVITSSTTCCHVGVGLGLGLSTHERHYYCRESITLSVQVSCILVFGKHYIVKYVSDVNVWLALLQIHYICAVVGIGRTNINSLSLDNELMHIGMPGQNFVY